MKKALALLTVPAMMMAPATPALAQASLPHTADIVTESAQDIGDLTVSDGGMVVFEIDEGATAMRLAETLLYVGDEPPDKIKPERFPYKHEGLGGMYADFYRVDLAAADTNGDGIVYIAAQVGLTAPAEATLKKGKPSATGGTAWAQGDESTGKGKKLKTFFSVSLGHPG